MVRRAVLLVLGGLCRCSVGRSDAPEEDNVLAFRIVKLVVVVASRTQRLVEDCVAGRRSACVRARIAGLEDILLRCRICIVGCSEDVLKTMGKRGLTKHKSN